MAADKSLTEEEWLQEHYRRICVACPVWSTKLEMCMINKRPDTCDDDAGEGEDNARPN